MSAVTLDATTFPSRHPELAKDLKMRRPRFVRVAQGDERSSVRSSYFEILRKLRMTVGSASRSFHESRVTP
jgi:hypothetical protein